MAKIIYDAKGMAHLRSTTPGEALCGAKDGGNGESENDMTCPECAKIALHAMELVTRAEKRDWRKL